MLELKTHPSHNLQELEDFFNDRNWPVTYIPVADTQLVIAQHGEALQCADGRSDFLDEYGPRVFGGINSVAAMLTGGDLKGFQRAAIKVSELGFAPGTHSADHGGCGYCDLWVANDLRTAIFPYQLGIIGRQVKTGQLLRDLMKLLGGKHVKLNGQHQEEAVRLNPFIGYTEKVRNGKRFRNDDWVLAQLGVPPRQRYYKIAECVEKLKPDAAKLEVLIK